MTERVDDVDPLGRVEGQAPLEQVDCERVRSRVQGLERLLLLVGQRAQVVATPLRADRVKVLQRRRAEDAEDQGELVVVCVARTSGTVSFSTNLGGQRGGLTDNPARGTAAFR